MNPKIVMSNHIQKARNQFAQARGDLNVVKQCLDQLAKIVDDLPDNIELISERRAPITILYVTPENFSKFCNNLYEHSYQWLDIMLAIKNEERYQSLVVSDVLAKYPKSSVADTVKAICDMIRGGYISKKVVYE